VDLQISVETRNIHGRIPSTKPPCVDRYSRECRSHCRYHNSTFVTSHFDTLYLCFPAVQQLRTLQLFRSIWRSRIHCLCMLRTLTLLGRQLNVNCVGYVRTLSVCRSYSFVRKHDWRLINWKGFGNRWTLPNEENKKYNKVKLSP
jgi:hypothetical protein